MAFQTSATGLSSLRDQHLYIPSRSRDGHCPPIESSGCCHRQEGITGQDNFVGTEGDTNTVEVLGRESGDITIPFSKMTSNCSLL